MPIFIIFTLFSLIFIILGISTAKCSASVLVSNNTGIYPFKLGNANFQGKHQYIFCINFGKRIYNSGKKFAITYSPSSLLRQKFMLVFKEGTLVYETNNIMNHYLTREYANDENSTKNLNEFLY